MEDLKEFLRGIFGDLVEKIMFFILIILGIIGFIATVFYITELGDVTGYGVSSIDASEIFTFALLPGLLISLVFMAPKFFQTLKQSMANFKLLLICYVGMLLITTLIPTASMFLQAFCVDLSRSSDNAFYNLGYLVPLCGSPFIIGFQLVLMTFVPSIYNERLLKKYQKHLAIRDAKISELFIKALNSLKLRNLVPTENVITEFSEDSSYFLNNQNYVLSEISPKLIEIDNNEKLKHLENTKDEVTSLFTQNSISSVVVKDSLPCEALLHTNEKISLIPTYYGDNALSRYYDAYNQRVESFNAYLTHREHLFSQEYISIKIGVDGEIAVSEEVDSYGNLINLDGFRLEVPAANGTVRSIENDNIIISTKGIFVLEVKNLGSTGAYDIKVEKDGRWLYVYKNGITKPMNDIGRQNNEHVKYLERFINAKLNNDYTNYIYVKGLIVIANDRVSVTNEAENLPIVRPSGIYPFITSHKDTLKPEQMTKIRDVLMDSNLPPKKYPIIDFSNELGTNIPNLVKLRNDFSTILDTLDFEQFPIVEEPVFI